MRIRVWPKTGSRALHFKLTEIFISLLNEYVNPVFLVTSLYFLCQTSPVSPRAQVKFSPDPDLGWFSQSKTSDTKSMKTKKAFNII